MGRTRFPSLHATPSGWWSSMTVWGLSRSAGARNRSGSTRPSCRSGSLPHAGLSLDVPVIAAGRFYDAGMPGMRVVLAEDSVLLRQGLVALLTEHPAVAEVIEAGDLGELLSAVSEQEPDVVLADIRMPPTHTDEGIRAAERFRRTHPQLGVVVLSQHADAEGALALVAGGSTGRGYLLKERVADVEHLVSAMEAVRRGESVIDPHVVDALMRHRLRFEASPVARLTSREREVLGLIATGASNSAIATSLHVNSIFTKLDLPAGDRTHRRVAAVLLYLGDSGSTPTPVAAGPAV